uniref:cDNA sequence BC048562 n=1 Tax=Nannospalax galili TaxID=1026970 RepID=A0A8C6QQ29_NANGA
VQRALVGSWHNSGFYGHYRGQVKSESAEEYRLAAKPQPPAIFQQQCQEPARQHFSKHDNRTSFDKGPYSLLQGIRRWKDLECLWKRHTFLHWAPCELEMSQQGPLESSYQTDFQSDMGLSSLPQCFVHFMQVLPYANTTYEHNFCQPSRGVHCGSTKERSQEPVTAILPDLPGIPRPQLLQHYFHAGVSKCLNWSQALNSNS